MRVCEWFEFESVKKRKREAKIHKAKANKQALIVMNKIIITKI